jgi:hypothetical protein
MNRLLKALLILTGLALTGYAVVFKNLAIHSPQSAWENALLNESRRDGNGFSRLFSKIMDQVESGWSVVIVAGIAIAVVACFIKTSRTDLPPEN